MESEIFKMKIHDIKNQRGTVEIILDNIVSLVQCPNVTVSIYIQYLKS